MPGSLVSVWKPLSVWVPCKLGPGSHLCFPVSKRESDEGRCVFRLLQIWMLREGHRANTILKSIPLASVMSFRPRREEWGLSKRGSSAWPAGSAFSFSGLRTSPCSSLAQYLSIIHDLGFLHPRPANWLIKKGNVSNEQTCSPRETCSVLEPRSKLC